MSKRVFVKASCSGQAEIERTEEVLVGNKSGCTRKRVMVMCMSRWTSIKRTGEVDEIGGRKHGKRDRSLSLRISTDGVREAGGGQLARSTERERTQMGRVDCRGRKRDRSLSDGFSSTRAAGGRRRTVWRRRRRRARSGRETLQISGPSVMLR